MPDTAFVFIYFQAAERHTWIAHDASGALSSAIGQEAVPALGRAPEMSTLYIQAADIDLSSQLPLFRPFAKKKSGYTLRNGKLSYTRCREIFKDVLKDVSYDPKDYGLHSLRSGGVTSVVSNDLSHNVAERLLKLHGRWKSDEAKDTYVLDRTTV